MRCCVCCVVCCGSTKVHIHSNEPPEVWRRMATLAKDGVNFKEKAEDMREQVGGLAALSIAFWLHGRHINHAGPNAGRRIGWQV